MATTVVHKRNPFTRAIGVELEIVGFKNPTKEALTNLYNTCVKWNASIGTDGSLHSDSAVEIRTAPAAGLAFVKQIREITRATRAAGGFVNDDCGLHVHVDMRSPHSTPHKLDCLTEMWALCEEEFYSIVEPRRATGTYSKPWYHQGIGWYVNSSTCDALPSAIYGRLGFGFCRNIDRYSGLNLQALSKHSTVEFRLHQGSINTRIVTAWALLCAAFVVQATETQAPAELWQFAKEIGPLRYLKWLAPTKDALKYTTYLRNKSANETASGAARSQVSIVEAMEQAQAESRRQYAAQYRARWANAGNINTRLDSLPHVVYDISEEPPVQPPTMRPRRRAA